MALGWRDWKLRDFVYAVVIPVVIGALLISGSLVRHFVSGSFVSVANILVYGIAEAIVIVAVPLFLGLFWNQWAGGASGFLLGSIYALWYSDKFLFAHHLGDVSLVGYLVSGMLIGYMAGALNKRSENFARMLISGLVSASVAGVLLFIVFQLTSVPIIYGVYGFAVTLLPRIACGVLVPVIVKIFLWYGISPRKT